MVIVEFLDSAEATHAVDVLKQFGLEAHAVGREVEAGEEAPVTVWRVYAPQLLDTPKPERDEVDDYIDTKWDRIDEERLYGLRRGWNYD